MTCIPIRDFHDACMWDEEPRRLAAKGLWLVYVDFPPKSLCSILPEIFSRIWFGRFSKFCLLTRPCGAHYTGNRIRFGFDAHTVYTSQKTGLRSVHIFLSNATPMPNRPSIQTIRLTKMQFRVRSRNPFETIPRFINLFFIPGVTLQSGPFYWH